jgi:hypothetical protein
MIHPSNDQSDALLIGGRLYQVYGDTNAIPLMATGFTWFRGDERCPGDSWSVVPSVAHCRWRVCLDKDINDLNIFKDI